MARHRRRFVLAAVLGLAVGAAGRAEAGILITIDQVGSDVVATGSGTLDIAGLSNPVPSGSAMGIAGTNGFVILGTPPADLNTANYGGISGPTSFGMGPGGLASSGSGDTFGVLGEPQEIILPAGYMSGRSLSATDTFANVTLSDLGLTPGTYIFTLPNDTFTVQVGPAAVPEPSTLLSGGLAALLGLGYAWRKRRAKVA